MTIRRQILLGTALAGVGALVLSGAAHAGKERIGAYGSGGTLLPQPLPVADAPAPVRDAVDWERPAAPQPSSDYRPGYETPGGLVPYNPGTPAMAPAVQQPVLRDTPDLVVEPDDELVQFRRRPGEAPPPAPEPTEPVGIEAPPSLPRTYQELMERLETQDDILAIPDRWRLLENFGKKSPWWDPYNNNVLKGDKPVFDDWFILINAISDTIVEPRAFPVPVGVPSTARGDSNDTFGDFDQLIVNQNFITNLTIVKGNTAFRPPDYEIRITPVFNINYADVEEVGILHRQPEQGTSRGDSHIGWQELFLDYHIRNVSTRYDFDSVRAGIQPFNADFRGFLFQDNQLGLRLFGTRNNNIFQYNLAWFRRLEKDTNSGLNDLGESIREDDVFFANLYFQDFPALGFVSQATVAYNRNREDDDVFVDNNGFLQRPVSAGLEKPKDYDVVYLGFSGDGHFDRLNITGSFYYAIGEESRSLFFDEESDISAFMAAIEPSIDFSWIRLRGSLLYQSGDDDPFDDSSEGFAAIFENPQFAGADTSFWIRQNIPLIGGGGVTLSTRNGILADLRASKEHGQSNFNNPGLRLLGFGTDLDILPELRLSTNFNRLDFADTAVLEVLRNQGDIDNGIGWDLSVSAIYRPFMTQNIVFRLSYAALIADDGFKQLYETEDEHFYTVLANLTLAY